MSRASAAKTRSNGSKRRLAHGKRSGRRKTTPQSARCARSSSRPSRLRGSAIRTSSTCSRRTRASPSSPSEAERLSGEESLAREAWTATTAEWAALARSEGLDDAVSQRYEQAVARGHQRAEEQHAAEERTLRQQLQRIEQLIERAQKRSTAGGSHAARGGTAVARSSRRHRSAAPVEKEQQAALLERLKAAATAIAPRVHDLREMDEWKRFANAAVQEELIAKAEALRARFGFDAPEGPKEEDLDKAARELHDIQERWKSVAEAPRAQAQALWHRYRQAADPIQARLREFFSHRNEERKGNLEKKLALIVRAEALADSTDWIKTADELKKLQAEWQQIGPVPRQETRATWKQFREACDRFTRRNADLAERKETWTANLTRKEALCARAEELATSREWDKAAAEIRRLQADWKTIGPVRRNKSRPSGSASAPPATRSSIATSGATRSSSNRSRPTANSSSPSSRHCRRRRSASTAPTPRDCSNRSGRCATAGTPRHRWSGTARTRSAPASSARSSVR